MKLNKKHPFYIEDIDNVLRVKGLERLKGKTVLVTGATGLIGVHLIDVLMALDNVQIYAVGRSKSKAFSRLGEYFNNPLFHFIEQDVCQEFSDDVYADYVIPAASNTHPLAYSQYPIETIMINVKGAENALELACRCNATLLYMSSVEVYGEALTNEPVAEDYTGKLNLSTSRSCYTESKRVSEALCQSYISEKGAKAKIVRLSRIFGPTMLDSDTKASSQFIKKAIEREDIILKSKGEQYFSYTYASDAVAAMLYVMLHGEYGKAYNISNSACNVHLKDFAQMCSTYSGKSVIFEMPSESEKKGFSIATNATLDNTRLVNLGFKPLYGMEDAIRRTIEILRNKQ